MKLAGLGVIVAAAGLIVGADGLMIAGGLWVVSGLLLRTLVERGGSGLAVDSGIESEIGRIGGGEKRTARLGVPGVLLLLVCGLGSIAIGITGTGFPDDYDALRWFPFAVGLVITLVGLVSIPVELGMIRTEVTAEEVGKVDERRGYGSDSAAVDDDAGNPEKRLAQLDGLRQRGLVTAEEYEAQRDRILRSI